MRLHKLILAGAAAGAAIVVVRRRTSDRHRVELAYVDGSTVVLDRGTPARERLEALGRDALAAARR